MDEYTDYNKLRFPRQGNLDAEGDWYERGRKRLARCRIFSIGVLVYAIVVTVLNFARTCS